MWCKLEFIELGSMAQSLIEKDLDPNCLVKILNLNSAIFYLYELVVPQFYYVSDMENNKSNYFRCWLNETPCVKDKEQCLKQRKCCTCIKSYHGAPGGSVGRSSSSRFWFRSWTLHNDLRVMRSTSLLGSVLSRKLAWHSLPLPLSLLFLPESLSLSLK